MLDHSDTESSPDWCVTPKFLVTQKVKKLPSGGVFIRPNPVLSESCLGQTLIVDFEADLTLYKVYIIANIAIALTLLAERVSGPNCLTPLRSVSSQESPLVSASNQVEFNCE